jgi:hypothetical protein
VHDFDSQGFSITTRDKNTTSRVRWVAIKLGGPGLAALDIDAPTAIGDQDITVGFESTFGLILGTLARAYDVEESDSDGENCMIGVATADEQYVNQIVNEYNTSDMNTASGSNDSFIQMNPGAQTCNAGSCYVATLTSFDSTSWNLNYTSVFSNAVRKWVGLAVETAQSTPPASTGRRMPFVLR